MSEIKLSIEVPGLVEAINNVAKAISNSKTLTAADQNAAKVPNGVAVTAPIQVVAPLAPPTQECPIPMDASNASGTTTALPVNEPASVPSTSANAEVASVAQTSPVTTSSHSEEKIYTKDKLSNAGAALCSQGKMGDLVALLNSFGVQAITQIAPENYPALAEGLKALGAKL